MSIHASQAATGSMTRSENSCGRVRERSEKKMRLTVATAIGTPQRAAFCHRSAMGRVSQLYSDVTTVTTKKTNADKSSRHLLIGVQPPRVAEFGRGRASAAQARFRRFERGVATLCVVLAA